MKPTIPRKTNRDVQVIRAETWNALLECLAYAMEHPRGDGSTILNDGAGNLRAAAGRGFGGGASATGGASAGYRGYFRLTVVAKTRRVENPDYDPEDPESEEYVTEEYKEAHHSGGRWTVNGQLGTLEAGDVPGDLTGSLQDVVLHYHVNSGEAGDTLQSGAYVELSPLLSNDEYNAYWLIGQASTSEIVQQSHGVPAMILASCHEAEPEPETEPGSEE